MEKSRRYKDVDIVKGIGIVLMLIGHINFGGVVDFYIHSFHMPLFFIMSGFLYKDSNEDFFKYTKKKLKSLIVPYIVIGLLHFLIKIPYIIYCKDSIISPLQHLVFYNSDELAIAGALWFLTSIFFAYEYMYIVRCFKAEKLQIAITFGIVALGYVLSKKCQLPWSINQSLACFGFMYYGYIIKCKGELLLNNKYVSVISIILGTVMASNNGIVNVRLSEYGNFLEFYIAAILIVSGIQGIVRAFGRYEDTMVRELRYIGANSLLYMCFNQLFVWIPNKFANAVHGEVNVLCFRIAELILTLYMLKVFSAFLSKNRVWRIITGRTIEIS